MLNVCVLSGPVLTDPEFKSCEGVPFTTFYLGITIGPYKAGVIKVCCHPKMASMAETAISKGDRVAVSGAIGRYEYEDEEPEAAQELALMAQDFELIRTGSNPGL
jgi:single-stranded DNA-binding protein